MSAGRHLLLTAASVALLLGGGYGVATGLQSAGTCGGTVLVAESVDGSEVETSDRRVAFGNLTAAQQALVERAVDGERPDVTAENWPWMEKAPPLVEYEGEYYQFYAVTTECAVPPAVTVAAGALAILAGLGTLGLAGRGFARTRGPSAG